MDYLAGNVQLVIAIFEHFKFQILENVKKIYVVFLDEPFTL